MIIDVHCHLWGEKVPSRLWLEALVQFGVAVSGRDEERVRRKILEGQCDTSGDLLVHDMDEAGIDKAVILVIDVGLFAGVGVDDAVSLEEQHRIFAKAVERHPDRLIAFAGVDPRRPDAVKLIERAVKEWDFKGLKLFTPAGFYPNDKCAYLVYTACQNLGIPVWVHSGTELAPFAMTSTRAVLLDEVAAHFPELKIVIAHAGELWWREAAQVARTKPNVSVDISAWQFVLLHNPLRFYKELRDLIDIAGVSRVMFGSDWPATRLVRRINLTNYLNAIKETPAEIKAAAIDFSESEISAILGDNAKRLLNL